MHVLLVFFYPTLQPLLFLLLLSFALCVQRRGVRQAVLLSGGKLCSVDNRCLQNSHHEAALLACADAQCGVQVIVKEIKQALVQARHHAFPLLHPHNGFAACS